MCLQAAHDTVDRVFGTHLNWRVGSYNEETKRVEVVLQGWAKRTLETDYIVLASTHIDPKVDAARESGMEIDQVLPS